MSNTLPVIVDDDDTCQIDNRIAKQIPIESIIAYAQKNLSYAEIAELVGCSKQNVQQRLNYVGYTRLNLDNFSKHRADTFAHLQSRLLNSIADEDLKDINPLQRVVAAGILYDKERLERGKSTSNINVVEVTGTIADLQAQASKLRESL